MSHMPKEIDYTMMSTFLTCRKKYWWRMVRDIVLNVPQTAPEFGRCIHKALDHWFVQKDADKSTEVFNAEFVENPMDDKRTKKVAAKMLQLYHDQWNSQQFDILAIEEEFTVPIPETEHNLIGRIDKIINWDDAVYVLDHKTTSRLGAEFFYKAKPNMQFDGYVWAARQIGFPTCSGVVVDALLVAKGLIVPSQLAKLRPVARDISYRSEEDIERYLKIVTSVIRDLEICYNKDEWYENTESCCDYGECPYRSLCKEDDNVREKIVESDYKIEKWEPRKELHNA